MEPLGLTFTPDFITAEEETWLVGNFTKGSPKDTKGRNSIQRFGWDRPKPHIVSRDVPDYFTFLLDRLVERGLVHERPNSVAVNEYLPGQRLGPHIDGMDNGPLITILGLLNPAVMTFRNGTAVAQVEFLPRALMQLRDEVRTVWTHAVEPLAAVRYSVVFRHSSLRKSI